MKTLINLIYSAILIASVIATHHPFVGEHENASSVERPDGTVTMRLSEKIVSFSKYDYLIDRDINFGPELTIIGEVFETIFGKSVKRARFEK